MKLNKESTYSKVIHYLALVLFTGLFAVGFVVTGYNGWVWSEFPELKIDNPFMIVLMLIIVWFVLKGLSAFYDRFLKNVNPVIITAITCLLVYGISVLWVVISQAVPQADQLTLYENARDINNGTIAPMTETSYLVFFPYQLGFVSFLRILIKIFGEDNYKGVQLVLALFAPVIVAAGSGIIKHLLKKDGGKARFIYCVLMFFCLPMYIYTTFIYGDLPFAAMSLVCIYLLFECTEDPKVWKYVLFFLCCGVNYLLKANALIIVMAMGIFLVISLFFNKEKRNNAIILLVLMLIGTFGINALHRSFYSELIPGEYDAPPFIATVVMGMNDDNSNAGWCNFYHQNTFVACDFDAAATKVQCRADLIATVKYWVTHPLYTVDFFYRKINLQWNTPFYQALCMNSTHLGEGQPALGKLIYDNENVHMALQKFMKAFQLSAYGFIALALLTSRKKERELKVYVPMIAIFGSFLFSLIWESKTRYQMPAFIMIIPCMAAVIPFIQEWAENIKKTGFVDLFVAKSGKERKHYNGIDLFKFIMAMLVVAIHLIPHIVFSPGPVYWGIEYLTRVAVPFFFLAAGFLLAEKLKSIPDLDGKKKAVKGQIFKMIKLYLIWSVIYLPFSIREAVKNQFSLTKALVRYLQQFFFIGDHADSYILWYLLGSVFGLLTVYLIMTIDLKDTTVLILCAVIMALSMYFDSIEYAEELKGIASIVQNVMAHTIGNGRILLGMVFIPLGMLGCRFKFKISTGIVSALTGYLMIITGLYGKWGVLVMAAGFFIVAGTINLPDLKLWLFLRNLSTGYYFIHLIVWYLLYTLIYHRITFGPVIYLLTLLICTVLTLVFYGFRNKVLNSKM